MGIKKLFYIFKPIIPLLTNSVHSRLGKLGPEAEKKGTTCTTLKWVSKYDFRFANEEFVFSKITFIRGEQKSTVKRYKFD